MKLWRRINFDWQSSAHTLKQWIEQNPQWQSDAEGSWRDVKLSWVQQHVPQLITACEQNHWQIDYVAVFVSTYAEGAIHVDADPHHGARILFPVWNCEMSMTRFFSCTSAPQRTRQANGVSWLRCEPRHCTLVDQLDISQGAVVFRNTQPHQVVSENPQQPRVTCTVAVQQDLTELLK